jgi:hypothetical protein
MCLLPDAVVDVELKEETELEYAPVLAVVAGMQCLKRYPKTPQ